MTHADHESYSSYSQLLRKVLVCIFLPLGACKSLIFLRQSPCSQCWRHRLAQLIHWMQFMWLLVFIQSSLLFHKGQVTVKVDAAIEDISWWRLNRIKKSPFLAALNILMLLKFCALGQMVLIGVPHLGTWSLLQLRRNWFRWRSGGRGVATDFWHGLGQILRLKLPSAHTVQQEPGGGRGILIQWPTVVHATAYVVELYEENASSLESFRRCLAKSVYTTTCQQCKQKR